jgi:uncharacterized membrane protein
MKKVFIVAMFRLGLIAMVLFLVGFIAVYLLEVGFEISHGSYHFASTVLTTFLITPLIIVSFLGVVFFNTKIHEYKRTISS